MSTTVLQDLKINQPVQISSKMRILQNYVKLQNYSIASFD